MELISREAAITQLSHNKNKGDDEWELAVENDIQTIWKLPPIQPKRGKWVYCEDSMADCVDGYRCDQCGFFVPWDYQHKSVDYIKDYNFCPNCGAGMRGEQNG